MRHVLFKSLAFCLVSFAYAGDKVTQSIIVASVEGEVSSLNMIDDFKVTMGPSAVGKKISPKTILTTGKSGKVSLLFSNGTLITVKPGSRFYLRQYKQLEAVVEDLPQPGELEEEPTKSELSAHLDFGELIVKAPKLKKGSSMNLTSPLGTAGIRGTMFQLMAVRNSVSGDIMGGINLISGDIDFTDTGGNAVTLLSGQSIQLATSKLGEAIASQTGELVDLSSTYGPALTEPGAMPPPLANVFPGLGEGGDDSEEEDSSEDSSEVEDLTSDNQVVSAGGGDWDFIHEISSEVFFEIESSEVVSSTFSFADIQIAPSVETPIPEVQAPAPPAKITGDTGSGQNIDQYLGAPPSISLLDRSLQPAELVQVLEEGNRLIVEMRSPEENIRWADIDPGVFAVDFVTTDITSSVVLSQIPQFILENPADAPPVGQTYNFEVTYQITDFRNSRSSITRIVELVATRPTIELNLPNPFSMPTTDPKNQIAQWADIQKETIRDVRGEILIFDPDRIGDRGTFYFKNELTFGVNEPGVKTLSLIAKDWRGLTTESSLFTIEVTESSPTFETGILQPPSVPRTDPQGLFATWVTNQLQTAQIRDENGTLLIFDSREGLNQDTGSNGTFFFSPFPTVGDANDSDQLAEDVNFQIIAKDWRGLTSSQDFTLTLTTEPPVLPELPILPAIVRTDPAGAFQDWIDELGTLKGQDEIGDDLDFDIAGTKRGTFFLSPFPSVGDANDSNQQQEEISFQVVAKDWRGLTTESDLLTLSLSAEPPTINSLPQNLLNPRVPLTDPIGEFADWIQEVVNAIEDNNLIQSEENVLRPIIYDENASELKSTYYFSTPDLYSLGSKTVQLTAIDWRGLVTKSDLQIEVFANPPSIYDGPNALVFELSDRLLPQLEHNITGEDQFGNNELTISLESVTAEDGTPISNFEEIRLDQFDQNNMPYSFFYKITDSRGIETNQTKFVSATVTPPLLNSPQFESKFQSVSSFDSTMEYRDYLDELPEWLESAEAKYFNTGAYLTAPNSDITKTTVSFFNESGDSPSSLPPLQAEQMEPGTYEIKFSYIDPRYIIGTTHISWQDDLSIANNLPLYIKSTPPTIELRNGQEDTLKVELSDLPLNQFSDHGIVATHEFGKDELPVSLVQVWDAENQNIISLDTNFLNLSDSLYKLTYRALDYREVYRDFNRTVQIDVTSPTIDIEPFESVFHSVSSLDSTLEYYDPGNELSVWLAGAVGNDRVNNETLTVSVFQNGTPVSPTLTDEDPNNNDHLPVGEHAFTFQVTDPRWLLSPNPVWEDDLVISKSRNLSVIATRPDIAELDIPLTQDQEVDNRNWADLDPWATSLSASDVRKDGTTITFSSGAGQPENGEFRLLVSPDLFSVGSTDLNYTVRDWRGIENSITTTLNVIKTAPTIEVGYYDGARAELYASDDAISYLVETKYHLGEFPDDGPFNILPWTEIQDNRDPTKPFFKATAYDGVDISNLVSVDPTIINNTDLGTQTLEINVDDSEYRKKVESRDRPVGATNSLSLSVEIVDVIAPIMELDGDSSFTIDGIVSSNVDGNYKFPDPGYTIKDNFYSEEDMESSLNIQSNENTEFNYPEYNDVNGVEQSSVTVNYNPSSFKIFPDELFFGSTVDLGVAGSYALEYQNITDPSGNQADDNLSRVVEVRDIRHPIVKLYGSSTISENLAEILLGEQFYSDRGAFAYEDLSNNANGKVDWQEAGWDWSISIENWDFTNSSWIDYVEFEPAADGYILLNNLVGDDPVASLIEEFMVDPSKVASELRFRLTYVLHDKADNNGSAQRVINFSNTSNLAPTVELADVEIDNPYEVEVFTIDSAPAVDAFLGYSQYSTPVTPRSNVYYLATDDSNNSVDPTWNKVNFHRDTIGNEYYVDTEGNWHSYGDGNWRKFIIHYSAVNPDFPENIGTFDLEVRIQDTTPPSFSVPSDLSIEAGSLFSDEGISSLNDNYDNNPTSSKIVRKLEGSVYSTLESPAGSDDVFDDLSSHGFWTPGQYSIFYTATDDFNNSTEDSYNIEVTDSIAPHIALITEDFLNNPTDVNLFAEYDEETSYTDVPDLDGDPYFNQTLYNGSPWNIVWDAVSTPAGWSGRTFDKSSPYIEYYNDRQFYLKLSEITNLSAVRDGTSSSRVVANDDFGRSLIWHSAFKIEFVDGTYLQDPGVLVVNGSDYDVSNSVQISETNSSGQLTHMKFTYQSSDGVSSNEILPEYRKTLSFLDEEKPQISLIPEDTIGLTGPISSQYFLIEAGVDYLTDTRASGFNLWEGDTSTSVPDALSDSTRHTLSASAYDAVDGDLTEEIRKSFFDAEDNSSVIWSSSTLSGVGHLNKTYFVKYDVKDGDDTDDDNIRNEADPAYRYFIVKDTTAPVISADKSNTTVTLSADSTDPDVSDINEVKQHIVSDLLLSVTDAMDENFTKTNFNTPEDLDWSVTIRKPTTHTTTLGDDYDGSDVYPEVSSDVGYYVTITVKDDSGNVSSPITRFLKIGDYRPPVITLNGQPIIHDFFRYGKNDGFDDNLTAPQNQELLFAEQTESTSTFNSTGFSGGAHRLFLSQYNFTDPGAYAQDGNNTSDQGYFNTNDGFPDFNADGAGEGHAIIRVDQDFSLDADDMDIGIIYARSSLTDTTFQEVQEALLGLSTEYSSQVPDVNTYSFNEENKTDTESLNVVLYLIEYRVKDGWGNLSEIKTRRVYFYESRQYGNTAFYATPLKDATDITSDFPDKNLTALSDNQKDYDGDGISDFWENVLGTEYNDASSFPDSNEDGIPDLSSNQLFQNLSVTIPD